MSISAVSYALSGKGRMTPATPERIVSIAERLQYQPNAMARSLVGASTGVIALAFSRASELSQPSLELDYFSQAVHGAMTEAVDRGYALVVIPLTRQTELWRRVPTDGVVVLDPVPGDPLLTAVKAQQTPYVIAGRDPDDADAKFTVDNDHVASTRDCFDHMLQQGGVKRPALFAAKLDDTYTGDCLRAYRDWASEHGFEEALEVVPIAQGPMEAQVRAALSSPTRPDAVYANTEWLGTMTQRVCNELGLRVPEDVMIVACSDLGDLGFGGQRLTTLRVFPERIGKEAVELLIARIADPLIAETRKHIPTQLCPADTTNRRGAH